MNLKFTWIESLFQMNEKGILLKKLNDLEAYFIYSDEGGALQTYYTKGFETILIEEIE